jgi:small subunit ribosomal protein S17
MEKIAHKKQLVGLVTSTKMDKSITIVVERKIKHPIYGKFMKKSKKFMAHDELGVCNEGDLVKIEETRPLSKKKRWSLVEVVEKAK